MSDSDDGQRAGQDEIDDRYVTAATTTTTTPTAASQVPPTLDDDEKFLLGELLRDRSYEEIVQRLDELGILQKLKDKGYAAGVEPDWLSAEAPREAGVAGQVNDERQPFTVSIRRTGTPDDERRPPPATYIRMQKTLNVRAWWDKSITGWSQEELYCLGAAASADSQLTIAENYTFWMGSARVPPLVYLRDAFPRVMREVIVASNVAPQSITRVTALRDQFRQLIAEHKLPIPQNYADAPKAVDIPLDSDEMNKVVVALDQEDFWLVLMMLSSRKEADMPENCWPELMLKMARKFGYYVGTLEERRAKLRKGLKDHWLLRGYD